MPFNSFSVLFTYFWRDSMKQLFAIMALITGLVIALPAIAGDLVISRAVLEDATGKLTITDVAKREFKPAEAVLNKGFTDSAFWLRLCVRAPAKGSDVVLLIRQPYLNEIRLYEADAGDPAGWKTRVTGTSYPYSARDRASNSLSFAVSMATHEATYYLRLKTRSVSQMSVEALTPDEAQYRDYQVDLLEMFFVTSMLLLLIWAIHSYLLDRLPVVGIFVIHQAVYTLYGIAITGYLAPFIPDGYPHLANLATSTSYCGIGFTPLLFCRELFKPYEPPPALMRGLSLLLLVFPFQLAAIVLGYSTYAVISNVVLVRVSWWYFVVMTFTLRKEQQPTRRMLQIFFGAITLILTLFWLSSYSISSGITYSLSGRQILIATGLMIGGLFAMVLNARLRRLLQEAQQSTLDLLLTQKTLELERALKEKAECQARTDFLTGLFNRRHFLEVAEHEPARALRYQKPLSLLMIDIDHFKLVNDNWGHSVGDAVLQEVAHLIRNTLRDADILARMGGEEFAALLVETDEDQAIQAAQRLCDIVASTEIVVQEDIRIHLTLSVGLTELSGRVITFDSLLKEADAALYKAKQAGRNRVISSNLHRVEDPHCEEDS